MNVSYRSVIVVPVCVKIVLPPSKGTCKVDGLFGASIVDLLVAYCRSRVFVCLI